MIAFLLAAQEASSWQIGPLVQHSTKSLHGVSLLWLHFSQQGSIKRFTLPPPLGYS
jgi:hypothetical protein